MNNNKSWKICGIIPAAGLANRMAPLPFSKELIIVENGRVDPEHPNHPKTAMQYLLENMRDGGAENVFVVIRNNKWDIPAYFGDGSRWNLHLAYLMMGLPFGHPFTISQAYPFIGESIVLAGFPDILITPSWSYKELTNKLISSDEDAIIGLYPVDDPLNWDMVKTSDEGVIMDIAIKQHPSGYDYAWSTIAWKPRFSSFLHNHLQKFITDHPDGKLPSGREIILSDIINAAVGAGLKIKGHLFATGKCLDIGTPDRLQIASNILKILKDEKQHE